MESEERTSLQMMKYAIYHHDHFENAFVAFIFGLISLLINYIIEFSVIMILTNKTDVMSVVTGYTSFYSVINVTYFYFDTLRDKSIRGTQKIYLTFTKFRHDNPLKGDP